MVGHYQMENSCEIYIQNFAFDFVLVMNRIRQTWVKLKSFQLNLPKIEQF